MIRPIHILLLVAILGAAVGVVFMSGPEPQPVQLPQQQVEQPAPEINAAGLEEVVLPLPGTGPLQINIEYLGDANYQSQVFGGSMKGKVLDAVGEPLKFARIEVIGGPQDKKFTLSDGKGNYFMDGLLPGMHIFRIYSGTSAEVVRMQYISRSTERDWLIGQALTVKFEIRNYENKVLKGATVRSDFGLREGISDEKGIAELHGVPSGGRVVIDIFAEGHVATRHELNLFLSNTATPIKLSALEKGGRLAGRVKSWPGGDMPTVTVVPRTANSRSGMAVWEKFQDVRIDSNGFFSFDDLPTNQLLDVRVNHSQGVCDPRGRALTAGKNSPTRCDFIVRLSKAKVSGRVVDESGQPVVGAEVELLAAEPLKVLAAIYPSIGTSRLSARLPAPSQLRRTTRTNKSGGFSIALGDHIKGSGQLLLNVSKDKMVGSQRVIKTVGSKVEVRLLPQHGGAALELSRRLDAVLPSCEWSALPTNVTTRGTSAENLLEGYYQIIITRGDKTILREDKYWISGLTKMVL